MSEKLTCEELILGAGVIGLAVASRQGSPETFLIEAHTRFGCETSSRNSEVIHSGIHYPVDSWKTRLCLEGQKKLYAFCEQNGVPHAPCGKLTVARAGEEAQLDPIAQRARLLGVEFEEWTGAQVAAAEPAISETSRALFFPRTGIIDSHVLMAVLEKKALAKGATVAYSHRLLAAERTPRGWLCQVQSPDGEFEIEARTVINAAGLGAARLSNQALQTSKYEHRFCRGRYFTLSGKYRGAFKKLI